MTRKFKTVIICLLQQAGVFQCFWCNSQNNIITQSSIKLLCQKNMSYDTTYVAKLWHTSHEPKLWSQARHKALLVICADTPFWFKGIAKNWRIRNKKSPFNAVFHQRAIGIPVWNICVPQCRSTLVQLKQTNKGTQQAGNRHMNLFEHGGMKWTHDQKVTRL